MLRRWFAWLVTGTVVLAARAAFADVLSIRTIEYGSWPAAVAALQGDLHAEGRSVSVYVRDESGRPVACGEYRLALDAVGARAFSIGACDPATNVTPVRLEHRAALFAQGDVAPIPVPVGLGVVDVRVAHANTSAAPTSGPVVIIGDDADATLPPTMRAVHRVGTTCADAPQLAGDAEMGGSTLGGAIRPVYRVEMSEPSTLTLELSSAFGGEIDVFARCPRRPVATLDSLVFGGGAGQRLQFDLPAGVFYIVLIDADIHQHAGTYSFTSTLVPSLASVGMVDTNAAAPWR